MYTQVNFSQFVDAFRQLRPENFSYQGLQALFNYLTELEDDAGVPIELDVIVLCCYYAEDDLATVLEYYNLDDFEDLQAETFAVRLDNGHVLFLQF